MTSRIFFLLLCVFLYAQQTVEGGILSPLIVGGHISAIGRWPWQLSMQQDPWGTGQHYIHTCGAVVLDEWHALSAAHCFMDMDPSLDAANVRIHAGAFDLKNKDAAQVVPIRTWTIHPGFPEMRPGYGDDIAVIFLAVPLDLSHPNIAAIKLPADHHNFATNSDCWITGWGKTSFTEESTSPLLRELNIPVLTMSECRERWATAPISSIFTEILDTQICPADNGGLKAACQGDSGGPLSCRLDDGTWVLAGISSRGWPHCEIYPSIFTRVSKFLGWINQSIGKKTQTA